MLCLPGWNCNAGRIGRYGVIDVRFKPSTDGAAAVRDAVAKGFAMPMIRLKCEHCHEIMSVAGGIRDLPGHERAIGHACSGSRKPGRRLLP